MTPDQHKQVDALFMQLLELEDSAARSTALDAISDADVREEVRSLLCHAGPRNESVATSVGAVMRAAVGSGAFEDRTIGPGTRFERYRIERKIGQGGMGDVYEAVRENDFHKRVALKIVRFGLDSDFARARFQQERQTLAGLEHPYIARLLDGGEAANGCPYLVLEFVDGMPIDHYCEGRSRKDILTLFLKVCEAVEYAHRNLIVHRDLKPGNILVTPDGTPKLLDFGIAKLMGGNADATQTVAVALTPQYASPEQVRNQPITTASDVYSLGVILYLLLTGRKPYAVDTPTALELERIICFEPPQPPALGDELDDILTVALRKEPERRYASVVELSQDIERFRAGRPVKAAPDSFLYRSRKFVGLNKIGIAAVVAVILVLSGGLASTLYQKRQADQRFQQVRKLSNTFLFDINDQLTDIAGTTKTRAFVVQTAQQYLDSLSRSAGSDPELVAELAHAYQRVGDAQGAPRKANLGDNAGAEISYRKAVALYDSLPKHETRYIADAARSWDALAFLYVTEGHVEEASKALDSGFAVANQLKGQGSPQALSTLAHLYNTAGEVSEARADVADSIRNHRLEVEFTERWARLQPAADEANTAWQAGAAHLRLGRGCMQQGMMLEAEGELKSAFLQINRALELDPQNARIRSSVNSAALSLLALYDSTTTPSLERPQDAVFYARKALELSKPLAEADANDLQSRLNSLEALLDLAHALSLSHQETGLAEARSALAIWHEISHEGHMPVRRRHTALDNLRTAVPVLSATGNLNEARSLAAEIVRERRKLLAGVAPTDDDLWYVVADLQTAAAAARAAGDTAESSRLIEDAARLSAPFADAAGKLVPTAFVAASFYEAAMREDALSRRCQQARAWQLKAASVWSDVAAFNEYASMRWHRALAQPPVCLSNLSEKVLPR